MFTCDYLSKADKMDFGKIKEELLKEFERGKLNRDGALREVDNRTTANLRVQVNRTS